MQKEEPKKGNAEKINTLLSKIEPEQLFTDIDESVEFQDKLRNNC